MTRPGESPASDLSQHAAIDAATDGTNEFALMSALPPRRNAAAESQRIRFSNIGFLLICSVISGTYVLLILLMLGADVLFMTTTPPDPIAPSATSQGALVTALTDPNIRASIRLSLITCTLSAVLSLLVAIPFAYLLSRIEFWGKSLIELIIDIPIVLPPLVIGLSLLVLFQFAPFSWIAIDVVYQVPAVVLAQFSVACAFAIRTMKVTFDQIDPRTEQVALTLGCSRSQAFGWVVLPDARRGMIAAFSLAWARSLGEFGPLLIFAGTTRMRTEVLSTSVFLEMNVGNVSGAVAVSLIMVAAAALVLTITRLCAANDVGASGFMRG